MSSFRVTLTLCQKRTFAKCVTDKEVKDRLQENQHSRKQKLKEKQWISKQISKSETDENKSDDQKTALVIF